MLLSILICFFGMLYLMRGPHEGTSCEKVSHPALLHIHTKTWNQELVQVLGLGICRVK